MKLTDIIELAKQGYKPADIRELLKIETETEPQPEQSAEDPEPDYKTLYEEEKAKRQAAARKQEVAKDDSKSVEETLLDIAKMYI